MPRIVILAPPPLKPSEPALSAEAAAARLRALGVDAAAFDASLAWHEYVLGEEQLALALSQAARQEGMVVAPLAYRRAAQAMRARPHPLMRAATYADREIYTSAINHLENALHLAGRLAPGFLVRLAEVEHVGLRRERSSDVARLARLPGPFDRYFSDGLLPMLQAMSPAYVGFSLTFASQLAATVRWAMLLRERLPAVRLVLAGALVGCWTAAGIPLTGEPFSLFDRVLPTGDESELAALARELSGEASTEAAAPAAPWAVSFAGVAAGRYFVPRPTLPVALGRGCYWRRCTFCPDHLHPRYVPCCSAACERWLQAVAARFPQGAMLHLCDSALAPTQLEELASVVRRQRLPIRWHGFARVEPELARPEFARHLAEGGCAMLQLGIESASARLLHVMGKGASSELARSVLRRLGEAGIRNQAYLLFGLPGESDADREETLALVEEEAAFIHDINHAILNLPKGSPMHRQAERFGITEIRPFHQDTDLSLYDDFRCGDSHPRVEARRWLHGRFLKSSSVRAILGRLRSPFKASHQCFLESGRARVVCFPADGG